MKKYSIDELRKKAEKLIERSKGKEISFKTEDIENLLQEFQVYQVELEIQNEELKNAYEEINRTSHKFADLYDFAPIGYLTFDRKGVIRDCNLTATNFLMKEKKYLLKHPFASYLTNDSKDLFFAHLRKVFEGENRETTELELAKSDTEVKLVQLISMKSDNEDGLTALCRSALIDITEEKKQEKLNKKYFNELVENKNRLESLNKRLIDSEQELMRSNETKNKYFSILAHDLKNPFSSILGFSEYMKNYFDELSREELKEYVDDIYKSSTLFYNMLENVLEWARLQMGRYEFKPSNVNLGEMVELKFKLLEAAAVGKNITLVNDVSNDCFVYADQNMLSSIILNLASNAIKFTKPNGKVSISCMNNEHVSHIKVIDTGVGINSEKLKEIFFEDANKTTKGTANEKGTGLGLLITKELVEKCGGQIEVSSVEGEGTEFAFTLPKGSRVE